jgi:hypothetical protein
MRRRAALPEPRDDRMDGFAAAELGARQVLDRHDASSERA